jgi:hypothetical protein
MKTTLARDTIAALLAAYDRRLNTRLLPDVQDPGGTVRHALELSSVTLEPVVLYIDPDTNLIAKEAYVAPGPKRAVVEEAYSDYRAIDGVQIAFSADMYSGGQQVVQRRVTDVKLNAPLEASLFQRPAS